MINPNDIYGKPEVDIIAKDLRFSSYEIDYDGVVSGILKVWAIPVKAFLIDDSTIPPNVAIMWNHVSVFVNKGEKGEFDQSPISQEDLQKPSEFNLVGTEYITDDYEPYSEFTFKVSNSFYLVKARTVLNRAEPAGRTNAFGDPVLLLQFNTSIGVSKGTPTAER